MQGMWVQSLVGGTKTLYAMGQLSPQAAITELACHNGTAPNKNKHTRNPIQTKTKQNWKFPTSPHP